MAFLPVPATNLAQRQLGVIARRQLRRWLTPARVDGLVRHGTLVRIERGVYRVRGSALVPAHVSFAAALRAGPNSVISGAAVLGLTGVDGFDGAGPFEILVPPGRRLTEVRFPWRTDPHPSRRLVRHGDVRLTTVGDALVHAVRWRDELGDRVLRLGFHWLCWQGRLDRDTYVARLTARFGADPLAATLLDIIGGRDAAVCESPGEIVIGQVLAGFDPAPRPQVRIGRYRVDWFFEQLQLAIEYEGVVDHTGPTDRDADARRERDLAAAGIEVLRFTAADLRDLTALQVTLVTTVARRALELGVSAPVFDPSRAAPSVDTH